MASPATIAAVRAARHWAAAYLPGYVTAELTLALALVRTHPDAESPGYSQAKQARQRLEAELATRPDYTPSAR